MQVRVTPTFKIIKKAFFWEPIYPLGYFSMVKCQESLLGKPATRSVWRHYTWLIFSSEKKPPLIQTYLRMHLKFLHLNCLHNLMFWCTKRKIYIQTLTLFREQFQARFKIVTGHFETLKMHFESSKWSWNKHNIISMKHLSWNFYIDLLTNFSVQAII